MFSDKDIKVEISDIEFTGKSQQINSIEPSIVEYKRYLEKKRQKRLDTYFNIANIIALIIVTIYAYSIIHFGIVEPYLTFFVGSILAYYILKHPFDF